jgi:hypothetical protein
MLLAGGAMRGPTDVAESLEVPVLLVIYRRPDLAARVFDAIAAARPRTLFVAADGPASDDEAAACRAARRAVTTVTWPCEVITDFAAQNLGCRRRVSSALDWFFGACESGIVLEEDCLPSPDFFRFSAAMLERYRDDQRIVHVSGETYRRRRGSDCSYYFSKYALTWGWAAWRRTWQLFDLDMRRWPGFRRQPEAEAMFDTSDERAYWHGTFQLMSEGKLPTAWDYAWLYACMTQGLSIHRPSTWSRTSVPAAMPRTPTRTRPCIGRSTRSRPHCAIQRGWCAIVRRISTRSTIDSRARFSSTSAPGVIRQDARDAGRGGCFAGPCTVCRAALLEAPPGGRAPRTRRVSRLTLHRNVSILTRLRVAIDTAAD